MKTILLLEINFYIICIIFVFAGIKRAIGFYLWDLYDSDVDFTKRANQEVHKWCSLWQHTLKENLWQILPRNIEYLYIGINIRDVDAFIIIFFIF